MPALGSGNLISCDFLVDPPKVYLHDGFSETIQQELSFPGMVFEEGFTVAFDGSHLILTEIIFGLGPRMYVYDGFSTDLLDSFICPNLLFQIAFGNDGFWYATNQSSRNKITKFADFTQVVSDSFNTPGTNPIGVAFDGTNWLTSQYVGTYGTNDYVYKHDGFSSDILETLNIPYVTCIAWDGTNLICNYYNHITHTYRIDRYVGFSTTLLDSIAVPGGSYGTSGICWDTMTSTCVIPPIRMISLDWNGAFTFPDRVVQYEEFLDLPRDYFNLTNPFGYGPGPMIAWDGTNVITSYYDSDEGKYRIRRHVGFSNDEESNFLFPTEDTPTGADWFDGNLYIATLTQAVYKFDGFSNTVLDSLATGTSYSVWMASNGDMYGTQTTGGATGPRGKVLHFAGFSTTVLEEFNLEPDDSNIWVAERATGLVLDDSSNVIVVQDQRPSDGGGLSKDFNQYHDFSQTIDASFSSANWNYDLSRRIAARILTPTGGKAHAFILG
jgi:hypothetical protein